MTPRRRDAGGEPLAVAVYWILLRAYPSDFKRRATEELAQVFRHEYDEVRSGGGSALLLLWLRAAIDLARTVPAEHLANAGSMTSDLLRDVRHGIRSLGMSPGFTTMAVVILALGIGANTTIFTLVRTLFLEAPPHIEDPDRLVRINRTSSRGTAFGAVGYPDYVHFRDNNEVFDGLMAYDPDGVAVTIGLGEGLVPGRGWFVSDNYFDVLGARPAVGRWFLPEEDRTPGTHSVAVVSHALWQTAIRRGHERGGVCDDAQWKLLHGGRSGARLLPGCQSHRDPTGRLVPDSHISRSFSRWRISSRCVEFPATHGCTAATLPAHPVQGVEHRPRPCCGRCAPEVLGDEAIESLGDLPITVRLEGFGGRQEHGCGVRRCRDLSPHGCCDGH